MFEITALTKRHMLRFLRDRSAVFTSLLSVLILLTLYFLFIGRSYISDPSMDAFTDGFKTYLVVGVLMGGVLVVNTLSLSLGMMGNIVLDLEQDRLDAFLVTPVKRYKIIVSYFLAAILVSAVLTLVMWGLTILYVGIFAGYWYAFRTIVVTSLLVVFFTFISCSFMILLTTVLKSVNAYGTLAGVLGTLVGFIAGIYMPLYVLGTAMTQVSSLLPFTHMTILLRGVLLEHPYELLNTMLPPEAVASIQLFYGTNEIGLMGMNLSMFWMMVIAAALALLSLFVSYRRMTRKVNR